MPKPNFFIVGAPKCGTTALSEYLRRHPHVFMSTPKEPFYFATDFPNHAHSFVENDDEYLTLFDVATREHYRIGEASAIYVYSKEAIENIREFSPDAKIIVMLRNPCDLAYSMHSHALYAREEDEKSFINAWDLISRRKDGRSLPKKFRDRKMLYYNDIAKLGEQVERLMRIFPEEQVHVIFHEDLLGNAEGVYRKVLKFLGLPDDNRSVFPKLNKNKYNKWGWLAELSEQPPRGLVKLLMTLKNVLGVEQLGLIDILRKYNAVEAAREPLPNEFRSVVIEEFHSDISKLSKLTARDLSHWMNL